MDLENFKHTVHENRSYIENKVDVEQTQSWWTAELIRMKDNKISKHMVYAEHEHGNGP